MCSVLFIYSLILSHSRSGQLMNPFNLETNGLLGIFLIGFPVIFHSSLSPALTFWNAYYSDLFCYHSLHTAFMAFSRYLDLWAICCFQELEFQLSLLFSDSPALMASHTHPVLLIPESSQGSSAQINLVLGFSLSGHLVLRTAKSLAICPTTSWLPKFSCYFLLAVIFGFLPLFSLSVTHSGTGIPGAEIIVCSVCPSTRSLLICFSNQESLRVCFHWTHYHYQGFPFTIALLFISCAPFDHQNRAFLQVEGGMETLKERKTQLISPSLKKPSDEVNCLWILFQDLINTTLISETLK